MHTHTHTHTHYYHKTTNIRTFLCIIKDRERIYIIKNGEYFSFKQHENFNKK